MDYIGVEGDWKRSPGAGFLMRGDLSVMSLPEGLPESSGVPQGVQHLVGCPGGGQNSQWNPVCIKNKKVSAPFENAASQPATQQRTQKMKGAGEGVGGVALRNRGWGSGRDAPSPCPHSIFSVVPGSREEMDI